MSHDLQTLQFQRDAFGQLNASLDGGDWTVVTPKRCFPWTSPQTDLALLGEDGREWLAIPNLENLGAEARELLETALAEREFVPQIEAILSVNPPGPPNRWKIRTDRGETEFEIDSDDEVRRLTPLTFVITDRQGLRYRIVDYRTLDAASQKILQRYL